MDDKVLLDLIYTIFLCAIPMITSLRLSSFSMATSESSFRALLTSILSAAKGMDNLMTKMQSMLGVPLAKVSELSALHFSTDNSAAAVVCVPDSQGIECG